MDRMQFVVPYKSNTIAFFSATISVCMIFMVFGFLGGHLNESLINHNLAYSQLIPIEYPFENATHIQYNIGDEIYPKPSARLVLYLMEDPDGISFSGLPYAPAYTTITYDVNDNGKLRTYWLDLTNSDNNDVSISDTQIYPSFSFKVPVGSNSTIERVNEISQFVDVQTIETLPEVVTYTGYNSLPITINGTSYSELITIFDQFNNGTATLTIAAFDDFLLN